MERFHALHLTYYSNYSLTHLVTHSLTYLLTHLRYVPCLPLPAVRAPCARLQRGERTCRDLLLLRWHRNQRCGGWPARPQLVQGKFVFVSEVVSKALVQGEARRTLTLALAVIPALA